MMKTRLLLILSLFISVGLFAQTTMKRSVANQSQKPVIADVLENSVIKGGVLNLTNAVTVDFSNSTDKGVMLYDNGSFVTNPAGGPAGSDYSNLQTGNGSFGFGHSISSFYKVADDFTINATSWTVDSIAFYAYQTGSTTTSTMTDYRVRIWQGTPGTGTVVWGDTTTNRVARTHWSGCYRGSDLLGTTRPIMRTVCATPSLTLIGGTYWVEYAAAGSLTSGPWAVPITIVNTVVTGNAMQRSNTGVWANLVDGANQQGLPFQIYGTEVAATCPFPSTLSASNITTTSADLAWVETGSATAWNIEWGVTGFTQGTGTMVSGHTAQSLSLSTLTAATSYDFYVQADCGGDQSLWSGPYTFNTLICEVANQCNFTLNFTDSYGDGWNGASVTIKQGGTVVGTYTLANGASGSETVALCDAMSTELIFTSGSYPDECGFELVNPFGDPLTSFTDGSTLTGGAVFFTFTSSCTPPACPKPTNLTATNVTLTSAVLGWTEAGSATTWNIEYGAAGFSQGAGTTVAVTTNPYTLSGLTSATAYSYYVQADCGADQSEWVGPISFSTLCNIINAPYTESFEGATFPPACWTKANPDGGTGWASVADGTTPLPGWNGGTMTVPANGGTKAAYCTWNTGGATSNDQWLISPQINIPSANYSLFFEMFWFGSYVELVDVKISTTDNQTASFTTTLSSIDTLALVNNGWKSFEINLSSYAGQDVYIAFNEHVADNQADGAFIGLDLFRIDLSTGSNNIIENNNNVSIYPNPTTGYLNINNVDNSNIYVYNVLGEVVASVNNSSNFVKLDLNNLSKGTYVVKIINNDSTITKQITLVK